MRLAEKARQMRETAIDLLAQGIPLDDAFVSHEIPLMVSKTEEHCIVPVGKTVIYYEIINPDSDCADAQLVRAGVWKREDCGTLRILLDNKDIILAKINPDESADIDRGWITEKGELILRR